MLLYGVQPNCSILFYKAAMAAAPLGALKHPYQISSSRILPQFLQQAQLTAR